MLILDITPISIIQKSSSFEANSKQIRSEREDRMSNFYFTKGRFQFRLEVEIRSSERTLFHTNSLFGIDFVKTHQIQKLFSNVRRYHTIMMIKDSRDASTYSKLRYGTKHAMETEFDHNQKVDLGSIHY